MDGNRQVLKRSLSKVRKATRRQTSNQPLMATLCRAVGDQKLQAQREGAANKLRCLTGIWLTFNDQERNESLMKRTANPKAI